MIANGTPGNAPDQRSATAAETFRVAQMARASTAGRALAGMAARFAASGDALAEPIRERQDLGERWQRLDADIVKASSRLPVERKPAEEATLRAALDETVRRLDVLDRRIAAEFPDYAELSNPKPLTADAARALLAADEALLVYLATDQDTWLWVLRRDDIALHRLSITAKALAHEVTVLRAALDPQLNTDLRPFAEPALVLTPPATATPDNDGLLTASKIATLKLNADWVVLSACNTASDDGTPDAGGLSGLAKAFFYAGARSLLVSHWHVPSQATVALITGAFAELAKNPAIGRAEALRRSEMAMLDPASPPEFAHPLFWGAFVLAGEGYPPRVDR